MAGAPRAIPLKVSIILTLVVLLVHMVVLRAAPMALGLRTEPLLPPPPRAFITRTVEPIQANSTSTTQPVALATAPLRPRRAPRAQAPTTSPTPIPPDLSSTPATPPPALASQEMEDSPGALPSPPPVAPLAEPSAQAPLPSAAARPPRDVAAPVDATHLPASMRLKYTVQSNKFPFSLNSELLWQHTGELYEARLEFSAFGQARVQTSRGELTPQGLAPMRFSDKFRSELAAHFNRAQGKVTFSANTPDAPLLTGAQDRLSILVQLATMVASAPERYPQATTITIQTIGPRDADTWLFTVVGEETLTLPGGKQAALKLVRNPRQAFDQRVELWLAPALDYLPARIRITEANGDYVDQQWLATEP